MEGIAASRSRLDYIALKKNEARFFGISRL
jgi:hypothetical protein